MKFKVEDQYAEKWIDGNLQESPFSGAILEVDEYGWRSWTIEIEDLEDLINLGKQKECNLFIDIRDMRIVFTKNYEPD